MIGAGMTIPQLVSFHATLLSLLTKLGELMPVLAVYILDAGQRIAAEELNKSDEAKAKGVKVEPRLINNCLADTLGYGVLVGKYELPARILNDPLMQVWRPMLEILTPIIVDTETLFLSEPEV